MRRAATLLALVALAGCTRAGTTEPAHGAWPSVAAAPLDPAAAAELDMLEAAVRAAPADHAAADRYREAAGKHGATRRAIASFEQLAADGTAQRSANVHLQLGMAYLDAVDQASGVSKPPLTARALRSFDAALERDPTLWDARYAKGLVYLKMPAGLKQHAKAVEVFMDLLDWQGRRPPRPEFALTYFRLSEAYAQGGDRERAAAVLRNGLRQFPGHSLLLLGLDTLKREAERP